MRKAEKLPTAIAIAICLVACQRGESSTDTSTVAGSPPPATQQARDTTRLILVDRPTVIGFFPPADSAGAEEEGYSEGLAHVGFALQDAQACLGRDSSQTVMIVDTAVRLMRQNRVDTIRFPTADSLSYGAYLVAPNAQPLLVSADGPSILVHVVPQRIPAYFNVKPCRAREP